jgi:hypothetical protein
MAVLKGSLYFFNIYQPIKNFWGAEKAFFNHKEHKEGTKYTKVKIYISALCDLCENTPLQQSGHCAKIAHRAIF